ncbi:glutaredoxin [Marilutibacter alkalisoli]
MTAEELEISRSTRGYRFDAKGAAAAVPPVEPDEESVQELSRLLADPHSAVLMFALEWCEFCWSARKLFNAYDIPYRSVDLDAAAMQQGNHGGRLRAALRAHTGWNTLPQIFIGGEFIGGCTDLFDEGLDGRLQQRLDAVGIQLDRPIENPYGFLPNWLHSRSA